MASRYDPRDKFGQSGNIAPMKADTEFLGAADLIGHHHVRVRVVVALTYPKGYVRGGNAAKLPFPVLVLERLHRGEWKPCTKRLIVMAQELKNSIAVRAGSFYGWDWKGVELDIYPKSGVKSPKGGKTFGVRVRPTKEEQDPETWDFRLQAAACCPPPIERAMAGLGAWLRAAGLVELEPEDEREPGDDDPDEGGE